MFFSANFQTCELLNFANHEHINSDMEALTSQKSHIYILNKFKIPVISQWRVHEWINE